VYRETVLGYTRNVCLGGDFCVIYVCCVCRGKLFVVKYGMGIWGESGVYWYVFCVCRGHLFWLIQRMGVFGVCVLYYYVCCV
jgi:hypothetical protein